MTVRAGVHGWQEVRDRADGLEVWTRSTSLGVWQDWVLISDGQGPQLPNDFLGPDASIQEWPTGARTMVVTSGLSSGWPLDSATVMTVRAGVHGWQEVRDRADGLEVWTRSTSLGVWQDWALISEGQGGAIRNAVVGADASFLEWRAG